MAVSVSGAKTMDLVFARSAAVPTQLQSSGRATRSGTIPAVSTSQSSRVHYWSGRHDLCAESLGSLGSLARGQHFPYL